MGRSEPAILEIAVAPVKRVAPRGFLQHTAMIKTQ
jgi:hypothetical protein